ncbi:hypothetical protein PUN28_018681 [Cardiocondyla obscurior]|uniref:Secreted protein n=1 Tax=Cardiocondyla obscurior TaxID=286306 RepID=A0AAW2EKY4_9HYME
MSTELFKTWILFNIFIYVKFLLSKQSIRCHLARVQLALNDQAEMHFERCICPSDWRHPDDARRNTAGPFARSCGRSASCVRQNTCNGCRPS